MYEERKINVLLYKIHKIYCIKTLEMKKSCWIDIAEEK